MSKFKQGDVVEMVESDCPYFKKGDKAILLNSGRDHNNNPDWSCDFTINDSYYKSGHWYASESAMKPIKKKENGIKIEVEKVIVNDREYYKPISIIALGYYDLPRSYVENIGSIWLGPSLKCLRMKTAYGDCEILEVDLLYKPEFFNQRIETIKEAGKMLGGINKKRKWSGKETIII